MRKLYMILMLQTVDDQPGSKMGITVSERETWLHTKIKLFHAKAQEISANFYPDTDRLDPSWN